MSLASDLQNLRQKKAQEKATNSNISNLAKTYSALRRKKLLGEDAENDIGPVGAVDTFKAAFSEQAKRQTQQEQERTWFTAGGFDDGYQFGDVTKTILGTAFDTVANVGGGLLEMGENAVDAGAYLVGGVGELFGAKDFAEGTKNFIANDLYSGEEVASRIISLGAVGEGGFDDASVFGEKLDSVAQSGGQLAGQLAGQFVGIPWWVTSGVTSFGKEVETAFNEGATYAEAGLSGLVSAGAEILTEKLFGGSGLGEKGLIKLDGLTKALSGKTVKAFADLGIDMAAEGVEEVVSSVINRMGSALYKEENLAELLTSEEAVDEYIESFIGGAALGGIMNAAKVDQARAKKGGRDYRTGLTANEQKVFDEVYKEAIAEEKKKTGKELSKKEEAKIYDEVMESLQKGQVSTDTIERLLGGESYTAYQDAIKNDNAAIEEMKKLYEGEELEQRIKDILDNSKRGELKEQLSKEVFDIAESEGALMNKSLTGKRGSFLSESYHELAKRGQAFEADLSQYDEKYHSTIQKAIDSGILNNTRRTHEMVELFAKLSSDKGIEIDFTNNEKIKETSFAVEGKTVNGYVTENGDIAINVDSPRYLNSIVGHEITHVLEGAKLYKDLQEEIFKYAEAKGEYQDRLRTAIALYEGVEGYKGADGLEKIKREVVADLVGDYLFTDAEFVRNLHNNNRNVFQKIWDEIKYLYKVATAGSKEAKQLEQVKHLFEKVYQEGSKATGEVKHSLGYHAGDLGKAEGYWNMVSSNRGTGHFGTGTYFVGDEAQINDSHYGKRPHEKVEFDNYKLFKPLMESEGFDLHDSLKYINDNISLYPIASMSFDEAYDIRKTVEDAEDVLYWKDDATEAEKAEAKKALDSLKERLESIGYDPDSWDSDKLWEELKSIRSDYHSAKMKLGGVFSYRSDSGSLGYSEVEAKIDSVLKNIYDEVSQIEDAYNARYEDSPSTRFMKAMGYEGVDVRGFKGLDNTKYGSVIYDLKGEDLARKKEIGTARYSLSAEADKNYLDAVNRGDNETARLMVEDAALRAGYDRKMFHETDAENIHIFDISRGDHGGTDSETPYGIFTKSSAKNIGLGSRQMALYVKAEKTLHVANRADVKNKIPEMVPYFDEIARIDREYDALANELEDAEFDALGKWMDENPDADMDVVYPTSYIAQNLPADIDSQEYLDAFNRRKQVMEDWKNEYNEVAVKCKEMITKHLRDNGYDSMYFVVDGGSRGRQTDSLILLDSNQVKSADPITYDDNGNVIPLSERFNAKKDDIRYSLSEDSEGSKLTEKQAEYFKESKMRDENGNLAVMYHGSQDAGFHEFESLFSDDNTSFFFTDSNTVAKSYSGTSEVYTAQTFRTAEDFNRFFAEIGADEYEVKYENGWFDLYEDGVSVAQAETAKMLYDEFRDWTGLGTGSANYKVYLNLKNPLIVDAQSHEWDEIAPINGQESPMTTREYAQYAKENGYDGVIFKNIIDNGAYASGADRFSTSTVAIAFEANQIKSVANAEPTGKADIRYSLTDIEGKPIDSARITTDEFDTKYSLSHNTEIAKGQSDYVLNKKAYVSAEELEEAQKVTNAMVDVMMKYSSILPEDKIGKVLTKNGSYDRSVENTTICVRTLAYNEFVDKVQEQIGRPLTQMESFLVSQKLYDIATEPQCLYCYVSLDRKAFNDMLLRYMTDRDTVIAKYNNSDKSPDSIAKLYEEFLNGRKDTKNMKERFNKWIGYVDNGTQLLSLADIATEDRQTTINANGGILAEQLKDARAYAQSASWSKIQKNYVAYRDEILKLGDRVVKNLNEHYGMRWYSFSDYSAAFIVENMQQITDASIRGLKGLAYTKDTDFAEVFAPSGMNINVSVFVNQDENGNFFIDEKQSANFEQAMDLRERYPNVGIVATVTNDDALRWVGEQGWSDVIIPFHIVRTGTDVAEYYKWLNYTSESADTVGDKDLWNSYLDSLNLKSENARKKVSKNIYPNEHKNDKSTYLALCESRGLTPRFARFAGEPWYMKLVNETRLSSDESTPLKPTYNLEAAKASFQKFVDKGGYEGGWYKDGVDVDAEASIVAEDVLAGKKANEVDYGRQDRFDPEAILGKRKKIRGHGNHGFSLSEEGIAPDPATPYNSFNIRGEDVLLDAPIREDISRAETTEDIAPIRDDIANVVEEENEKKARLSRSIKRIYRNFEQDKADLQEEINLRRDKLPINDDSGHYALDQEYQSRLKELELQAETKVKNAKTAEQRKVKHENLQAKIERIAGDISTWVDKKFGFSYKTNTLRRNLRDIVRDENGNRDIAKADGIYELLQGNYNKHEAELNKEANRIKKVYADMKITDAESTYIQMLGEFRHNPDTQLKKEDVDKFLLKNKSKIDEAKVDKAIELARETYDSLLVRVNEALREAGMKEIPYRKGYFPHFTEDKQGWLAKLFNWKTQNNDIPTDIAGITEQFNPNRTWQPFNKQRKSDTTDYNFLKGMDNYVFGALDWIYHIEDIQTRREFENFIRYTHSEEGVREKIAAIRANDELDADETQDQIDLVYATAANPLNNFVTDLRAGTNKLANKKSSLDRGMEEMVNRKVYSTLTNISNRVSANMVGGSISSALTNFIPITQSWGQVSPISSLKAMVDTIRSKFRDDGTVQKSTFLTNRLETVENLYQTKWDKFSDKIGALMEGIDSFTSQTVWRSKYLENISKGMSEADAIANADQFAENVMAGRSRGNMPTIFDSKNLLIKTLTAFQLEVANQYGYMLKDMPQDVKKKTKGNLVKGYAAMFFGAYAYNALFSALTGRDAAFDPIGIIEDLLKDLGLFGDDDKEEPVDAALNLAENIAQEIPFFGGLIGGGRVPISSALPYDGNLFEMIEATGKAIESKDFTALTKEWLKLLYYVAMPVGGGQLKKTVEGLSMFSDDLPIAGSYTNSGDLRFPVEDNFGNRLQAALFGQWSSQNAREYFDKGWSPLNEKQQQEFKDSGMIIQEYHDYREGLKDLSTQADKVDYINDLDLTDTQKNVLLNNVLDRDTKVDVSELSQYGDLEEFDFAQENPKKYKWLNDNGYSYSEYKNADEDGKRALTWASENPAKYEVSKVVVDNIFEYRKITGDLYNLKADKDANGNTISGSKKKKVLNYINNLDLDYGAKLILYKSEYKSDDTYNSDIVEYLNSRDDLSFSQIKTILEELDFGVDSKGNISW